MVTCVQEIPKEGHECDMEEVAVLGKVVREAYGERDFTYDLREVRVGPCLSGKQPAAGQGPGGRSRFVSQ